MIQVHSVLNEEPGKIKDGVTLWYDPPGHIHPPVETEPQPHRFVGSCLTQEVPSVDTVKVAVSSTVSPLTGQDVNLEAGVNI